MRIGVLSDIHGDVKNLTAFGKVLKDCDLIAIAGDISGHGDLKEIEYVVKEIMEINENVVAVPGNMDGKESIKVLEELGVNLHCKKKTVNNLDFIGAGGSTKTPFGTPFELNEEDILNCIEKNITEPEKTIIICHTPPYKTKTDRTIFGLHVGSKALKGFIEDKQPVAFFCGHIHESANIDYSGNTLILNPGPFRRGQIGIVEIKDGKAEGKLVKK